MHQYDDNVIATLKHEKKLHSQISALQTMMRRSKRIVSRPVYDLQGTSCRQSDWAPLRRRAHQFSIKLQDASRIFRCRKLLAAALRGLPQPASQGRIIDQAQKAQPKA